MPVCRAFSPAIKAMLKHRLIFGTLMTILFTAVVILDAWLDGSITESTADDRSIQATILTLLITAIIIPAQRELSSLIEAASAAGNNLRPFKPLITIASIIFATVWYWQQFVPVTPAQAVLYLSGFLLPILLLYQYLNFGIAGAVANCGVNYFAVAYIGILSAFIMAIRIEMGGTALLMYVFVVKSADIGAYTTGKLFGKTPFSPVISPKKTWQGLGGAVILSVLTALVFSLLFDIMNWAWAVVFAALFAVLGQLSDLAESIMKRDARQKDSGCTNSASETGRPHGIAASGFGGILDIADSILGTAFFAYLFFLMLN